MHTKSMYLEIGRLGKLLRKTNSGIQTLELMDRTEQT